jgi:hypothetical protein
MALTIPNPTYATTGPSKTYQVLAPNENSNLEVAFIGRTTITLDGSTVTGTINFIDGTQAIFANGTATAGVTAPVSVVANIVGGSNAADLEAIVVNTGTPTTTGFPFYLTGAGTTAHTLTIQFSAYRS